MISYSKNACVNVNVCVVCWQVIQELGGWVGGNKEVGRKVGGRARKWGGGQIRVEEGWERKKLVSSLPIYHFF